MSRTAKKSTTALFALVVVAAAAMVLLIETSEATGIVGSLTGYSSSSMNTVQPKSPKGPVHHQIDPPTTGHVECRFNCTDAGGHIVHDGVRSCPGTVTPEYCRDLAPFPCPTGTTVNVACFYVGASSIAK